MRAETRPHEAGFGSNRVSEERGEYVPAPCTHRPSKHPSEVRMRLFHESRIWASQGGLSRNKVAVGESAAGSPPTDRDLAFGPDSPFILIAVRRWLCQRDSTRPFRAIGHLRTTKANNSCLVGAADRVGLIAQWQSASFARRMPWVRIPLSPSLRIQTVCLIRQTALGCYTQETDAPSRVSVDGKGRTHRRTTSVCDDIVCTCNPGVHWTHYS